MQWLECLRTFAPHLRVCKVSSSKLIDTTADVYVINPVLFKKNNNDVFFRFNRLEAMRRVRFVVVDELHQIVSKILHRAFFKVSPTYLLGLSATPYRPVNDIMKPAVGLFFGHNLIQTPVRRKHTVYVVKTGFRPRVVMNAHTRKLDWNEVLNSQATDENRNGKIVQAITRFPDRTWLVLVKRVEHARLLAEMMTKQGLHIAKLVGAGTAFDVEAKIVIGTTCKVGTGFDHALIDGLVVATDCVEYFEQFLGRCMRRPDVEPIVIDFEDSFRPLANHLTHRLNLYERHGGVITSFSPTTTQTKHPTEPTGGVVIPSRHRKQTTSISKP